jgi:hypothetical protein
MNQTISDTGAGSSFFKLSLKLVVNCPFGTVMVASGVATLIDAA